MKKGFFSIGLMAALMLCTSCKEEEAIEWKDFGFSITSNLTTQTVPFEGATVVFTVSTEGKWTYLIDENKTEWLAQAAVDGNTLAIVVPENTVNKERTGTVKFISVSDPTLTEEFTVTQDASPKAPEPEAPKADLLDVVFHTDGTAEDVSPLRNEVIYYPGTALTYYYHDFYKRMVTCYNHTVDSSPSSGYYRVNYYDNETFRTGVENGHTIEVLFRMNQDDVSMGLSNDNHEIKPMGAHGAGGWGMLISKANQNNAIGGGNDITFLPYTQDDKGKNYRWCHSKVVPELGRYYHMVGVWNSDEGMAYVYVDGKLCGTAEAKGQLVHGSEANRWLGIGVDANGSKGGNAWNGEVVIVRVFSEALTEDQALLLYKDATNEGQSPEVFNISDLTYLSECEIGAGYTYTIFGNGFKTGDKLAFTSTADVKMSFTADATLTEPTGDNPLQSLAATVPAQLPTGRNSFFMVLVRGGSQYPLGVVTFTESDKPQTTLPRIIAHRGQHQDGVENATENSIAALTYAQQLGIYGAEFDVWITTDDVLVVNHNATVTGSDLRIEQSTYAQLKDLKLANGEPLPTFEAYLEQGAKDAKMKLVCEIKTHGSAENNTRAVNAVVTAVKAKNMTAQVDFIAFDYEICKQLVSAMPGSKVQYLQGDKAPADVAKDKLTGIDYSYSSVLSKKPEWVKEAHASGIEVNAWTVNSTADMMACIGLGVDYITTDNPATLKKLQALPFVTAPK